MKRSPTPRNRVDVPLSPWRFCPHIEWLESRLQPGETFGFGLLGGALAGTALDLFSFPSGAIPPEQELARVDRPVLAQDAVGEISLRTSDAYPANGSANLTTFDHRVLPALVQPSTLAGDFDLLPEDLSILPVAIHRPLLATSFGRKALDDGAVTELPGSGAWHSGIATPWTVPGVAANAPGEPGSLSLVRPPDVGGLRLAPNSAAFDPWSGTVLIRGDAANHTIQEALTARGFLELTLDGQPHSSDPASAAFDPLLAGATAARVTGIQLDGGGGQDTLTLGAQQLAGGLTVNAPGATVVTHDVSVGGSLAIQAGDIIVQGRLQGRGIRLAATGWVNVEDAGSVQANSGAVGGRLAVFADKFVNTGQLHADGSTGGQIIAKADNILNAGSITADGSQGGGTVGIAFSSAYIDTATALTSANGGTASRGGQVRINGGTTGHLFSSGRQRATGVTGGSVDLLGREVVLDGGAVDASGESGGGSIRVGGDFHGANPAMVNADTVIVTPPTTLRADALQTGDGGHVVVWADMANDFQGAVSARGGTVRGAGGSIEVSSDSSLSYGGSADAGTPAGRSGTLLLDPKNLIISAAPVGVFPQFDLPDPHPTTDGIFGMVTSVLGNGNVVVTNPADNFGGSNAGAVYLFDGLRGTLISSLVGSNANDRVGDTGQFFGGQSIVSVGNGNYVILSPLWNGQRGAVTWGSGTAGVGGIVSEANSLVGTNPNDVVGGVTVLPNGNYVVQSPLWNGTRGAVTWGNGATGVRGLLSVANSLVGSNPGDYVGFSLSSPSLYVMPNSNVVVPSPFWNGHRGAVTWEDGAAGVRGILSAANSLVGNNPGDNVGNFGIFTLSGNNYVVRSPNWNDNRGAVTWESGTTSITGVVSEANSLVGSHANDFVGLGSAVTPGVTVLRNGNYVVNSPNWNGNRGAVTWRSGGAGVTGAVSEANSLVGSTPNDYVGNDRVTPLSNGNYVVNSPLWNGVRGAVTWGSGTAGITGTVSALNSLIGTQPNDRVGNSISTLPNGNYVVNSTTWNSQRGAVTWGSGTAGVSGAVSEANSLVGSAPNDYVGTITVLSNGNYVVTSPFWNGQRGAVTWGSGTAGVRGIITAANSLVGSNASDGVGGGGTTALSNGNYVIRSSSWNGQRGAVTWGSGTAGVSGTVSEANSLVGSDPGDAVGDSFILTLPSGNYVVHSDFWNNRRGAVTWGSGTAGVRGIISEVNSLVGADPNDRLGSYGVTSLSTGNYLVVSPSWNRASGAVTLGNGSTGITGLVSASNSLIGNPGDEIGFEDVMFLSNGSYVVHSSDWNGGRGAITWGSGTVGVTGFVSSANSLVGANPGDLVSSGSFPLNNGNYLILSPFWNGARGAVTWASGTAAVTGIVSEANSLVGSDPYDFVGGGTGGGIIVLSNGNYVVRSVQWNGYRGATTWGDGAAGIHGVVSEANSLVGSNPGDQVGLGPSALLSNGDYVVGTSRWQGNQGALTLVSGATGQTVDGRGVITMQNSLIGQTADTRLGSVVVDLIHQSFLASFVNHGGGRITVGLTNPNQFTYARAQSQSITLTPDFLTATLSTGTAVVLQASNDITVEDPITVSANGHSGALTLQAGRSILLNASIATDNGPLTLIANDTAADGVVDSQRDPGNAAIVMVGGTTLDTGTAPLDIELRDGAGLTHAVSRAINLQTLSAGSVTVVNDGPDAGSDIRLGAVTTSGPQRYSDPRGLTTVNTDLTTGDSPITFTDSVVINDGVSVATGSGTVNFAGTGTQTLQTGAGVSFANVNHTGSGTLQLTGALTVTGTLLQTAGTFDANDQPVTVSGAAVLTGGTYLAGTAPQTFAGGLVETDGTFTSSTGPMKVHGAVTLTSGTFGGQGSVDQLTAYGGTVAPGTDTPGVLRVAGAVAFTPLTTFTVLLRRTHAGQGYSQLRAAGSVNLGGSTLQLIPGLRPPLGRAFKILTMTAAGGIQGTFAGLSEGAVFDQGGLQFQITYQGGAHGRSVVLTRIG